METKEIIVYGDAKAWHVVDTIKAALEPLGVTLKLIEMKGADSMRYCTYHIFKTEKTDGRSS